MSRLRRFFLRSNKVIHPPPISCCHWFMMNFVSSPLSGLARAAGTTLQPTGLVHDAYVRLVNVKKAQTWNSRGHFFAAAAEAMRRILVERARQKRGPRRGGGRARLTLDEACDEAACHADELIAVHEALDKLATESSVKADLVKLRYFGGLGHQEAAKALGLSRATADRYWAYAKAFLFAELQDDRS